MLMHLNEELSFVEEFRYQGHVMTADCQDDKDIKIQFRRNNTVGAMLAIKLSFAPIEAKIHCSSHIGTNLEICALASFIPELD